ncbi:hypothetical protein A2696_01535 [Candidatus Curtissbacteria bacterium RIFCSPHIGHO2_01_FULL_41_13]|uniref:DUF6922 domain-containing protein n=1 Tax=Candidatus Curtissbacteria bacterium RIFCSPHIGHO2_01_FULL_41_13 TaxID=1797745 RepID=A0A1F5FYF9_9BACT|nr:MAG: hypothetical protein A2696_01535 [Candidatus Curtissbacteria bacterium RIFCSPHIGHO2_01_FULL_41_13]
MSKIPLRFKKYFWDTDIEKIDLKKHQKYVIERLLELGNPQAYRWLINNFQKDEINRVVSKSRQLSQKTRNFWHFIS